MRVFAEILVGTYIKSIPTHEKRFAVGKSGPNATLNLLFSWVGLALAWGVRQFHINSIIDMFFNPTKFGKWQDTLLMYLVTSYSRYKWAIVSIKYT